ncbi:T9SS type A sorting domain-containing protein [Polaribacter aestuariivivens]|uniref:T9SS type A sorting domain-containing protein n=1 Tax=Polaribacter aestuariivivens TaxID=2304626 RepID=A0A5S3N821_9FLAO|nr:endonuclease [Polaribacter aestuariivivens]TMM31480.1 T9SS type A sorting domain-containing protein [Polaribacter aestuariivivens]
MLKRFFSFSFIVFTSLISFSQESYYSDVNLNLTGITLKEELATKIIATHSQFLFYDQIWNASQATDVNPTNPQEVLLVYGWENGTDSDVTNNRTRGINDFSGSSGDWNREHIFSRSLGTPNLGEAGPGSDAHHLRPSDVQRNSSRGNRFFSDGSGASSGATTESYIDPIDGTNSFGWFPGDEWKGDVARMIMYMYLRYGDRCLPTNVGLGSSSSTPDDMIDLFLKWNVEDPVSDFEKARNNYHENTANQHAQGNRNPFIDNPILATRIWGGPKAEDTWGIYTSSDTEAPSIPNNLIVSNITTFSVDISWTASTDNTAVTSYDVFVDGVLAKNTTETSTTINNLNSNTNYSFTVLAKDIANNTSAQSTAINTTTLEDTEAPSIPTNIVISNQSGTSFVASWNAATDNTAVIGYDVFVDGSFLASTQELTYTVANLSTSTTYAVQISAKDAVNNKSPLSTAVNATTTDGSTTTANELFFSEYVEGSSNNKAVEIVNVTSNDIDLSAYSLKRQKNGGKDAGDDWENELKLSGTIKSKMVYVIVNGGAEFSSSSSDPNVAIAGDFLISKADFIQPNASETNFGAPINFNGDDPIGLFKNDVLIDIVGTYNSGGGNFGKDKTLRRKNGVVQPNTAFDLDNEWDILPKDTVDGIGTHSAILNVESFLENEIYLYPNPADSTLFIDNKNNIDIKNMTIFNYLGKKIITVKKPENNIDVSTLSNGVYFIKFNINNTIYSTKFIKK